jgi:hypothetical protein
MLLLQVMCADITMCKQLGADGVVFGCLSKAGDVNEPATARLLACATEQVRIPSTHPLLRCRASCQLRSMLRTILSHPRPDALPCCAVVPGRHLPQSL